MKKKLLITGGSGYLGIHLANKLKRKYDIILGSRNNKNNFLSEKKTGCKSYPLDVSNINSVRDLVIYHKPSIIIHCAATKFVGLSEKQPFECTDVNIVGSSNIARVAIENKVKVVIGISTDKATQPIKNYYGMSKAVMEKLFCLSNNISSTKFLCVRYGNVAWSTGSVLPIWKEMFKKNKTILTTGPKMRRFFFTVDDAVRLVDTALKNSKKLAGKILCPEMKSSEILQVIRCWINNFGGKYKIVNKRAGDRIDEYLIAENEYKNTCKFKYKDDNYYIIHFKNRIKNCINGPITSENCSKLSDNEIIKILKLGYKC